MKKLLLLAIGATLLLSSCSKVFYQVYTAQAPGLNESDNALVYENEDCKIIYDLWAEDGKCGFIMHNKTDKDLYVMLPQTFFIKNGFAFDYFKNRQYQDSKSKTVSNSWSTGVHSGSSSIIQKENPIVCIPPDASKEIYEYIISDKLIRNCNKKQAYPKTKSTPISFTKDNSPLNFKNRITYSLDQQGKELKIIENEFWISELINYSKKEAGSLVVVKECDNDAGVEVYKFKISAPNKFYNSYVGIPIGQNK